MLLIDHSTTMILIYKSQYKELGIFETGMIVIYKSQYKELGIFETEWYYDQTERVSSKK